MTSKEKGDVVMIAKGIYCKAYISQTFKDLTYFYRLYMLYRLIQTLQTLTDFKDFYRHSQSLHVFTDFTDL